MVLRLFTIFAIFVLAIVPQIQGERAIPASSSSFSKALEILQNQIGYTFKNIGHLRRAMTHSSFSEENNRALSMLGGSVIETSASLRYLRGDIDVSAEELSLRITELSKVETSCARDGTKLGLQNSIRVSHKTNSSTPSVLCGAFRAIFGAIAVDTGKSDEAGSVFWAVHGGKASDFHLSAV